MFEPIYEINKENVAKAVRRRMESDLMEKIMIENVKSNTLFYISAGMMALNEIHDFSKEQLLEFQKKYSEVCRELVKKSFNGNTISGETAVNELKDRLDITYNEQEDSFE